MRFHSMGSRQWGLLFFSLLSSVFAVACSDENPDFEGEGVFQRLVLAPDSGSIELPEMRELARWNDFEKGKQHKAWRVRGTKLDIRQYEGQEVLRFAHKDEEVAIELPLEAKVTESVVVNVLAMIRGETTPLTVVLFSGKEKIGQSLIKIDPKSEMRGTLFQVKLQKPGTQDLTKVVLKFAKGKTPIFLRSVAVKEGVLGMQLGPAAFGGYDLIEIGGDARRGTVLPSTKNLSTSFEPSTAADALRFSFARRADIARAGQDVTIKVTVKGADRSTEHEFDIDDANWNHGEISLADFVDESVTATWSLETSGGEGLCILGEPRLATRGAQAKTVLMVTSDTHRSDHLGFLMEEGELETHAIDDLAAKGVVFLDAVSSVNNTTPSHVSLFTGMSPRDTGIVANAKRLSDAAPTLAEAFRDSGYMTLASVSATPVNYKLCGLGQGFDRYSVPTKKGVRDSEGTLEVMMDWLEHYDGEPVFMWVHIYDAHGPYDPPEDLKDKYYGTGKDPFDTSMAGADIELAPYWDKKIADPVYTEALYKGEITYLDGRLKELFTLPRVDAGIIGFTSDHGEVLRYGPGDPFDHRGLSVSTLAVPMILKAPGLEGGVQRNDPVRQIDMGRTLLNLAGLSDLEFPGRDVLGGTLEPGEPRFALQANGLSASVLTDKWMFGINLRVPGTKTPKQDPAYHAVELYDIVNDRACRYNVWEENREKTATLRRLLIRWLERSQDNNWESESLVSQADIQKELADLGYVTVEDSTATQWYDSECECARCELFAE